MKLFERELPLSDPPDFVRPAIVHPVEVTVPEDGARQAVCLEFPTKLR